MFFLKKTFLKFKMEQVIMKAFPKGFSEDIKTVLESLSTNNYGEFASRVDTTNFILLTGEQVHVPYRVYLSDALTTNAVLTPKQQLIYNCIFSRSSDGFVREKHIRFLLKTNIEDWYMPYVFKVCSEYVV